jgi:hypothetical protein
MSKFVVAVFALALIGALGIAPAAAWNLPLDRATMGKNEINEILAGNDYPETTTYTKRIEFLDFTSYGKKFTQVVIRLDPQKPRLRNGKKLVVVGGEPGSEYAIDFLETVEGKEGMGIWLAKRGVTFIGLTRVGRWNFLAPDGSGSWKDIPLDQRMPIFDRNQKTNWSPDDYTVEKIQAETTASASNINRYPKPGTELYNQMLAANPMTVLKGYTLALRTILPAPERRKSTLLYWGMSTGGAFMFPLSKYVTPDGYLGWGTSNTGLAYLYRTAKQGNFTLPYDRSALRVRERGTPDLDLYTKEVPQEIKDTWWQNALKSPRFKSVEDSTMMFGAAALAEIAARLWIADFLPAEYRKEGFAKFVSDLYEPSFPPKELKKVPVLEMNGTKDEVLPPNVVDAHREVMEPYYAKCRVARVEGFGHYLFRQENNKVVGSLWLKFIDSGYFDRRK